MPYKSNSTNKQSKSQTGDPAGSENPKAGLQDANTQNLNNYEELEDKYTNELGEPNLGTHLGDHPNRNTNKPNIDKPRYS